MQRHAVIAGYVRTPFHLAKKGALAKSRPDDLVAALLTEIVARTGVNAADIEDLQLGCAFPEGEQGLNIGRMAVLLAGLPITVAGTTVNRWCGSSMTAIHNAAGQIAMGAGDAFLCGGVESMTRVPMMGFNPVPHGPLSTRMPEAYVGMGETAENLARKYGITRTEQEQFALASHHKAAAAWAAGHYQPFVAPITTPDGVVATDGNLRPDSTAEQLATLKPAFLVDGTVTAATSSPLTDGATMTLITSEEYARAHGLKIMARIKSVAVAGCAPEIMGIGPVPAGQKALKRAGLTLADIDLIELNEAFAAQSLAVVREMGIDPTKLNIDGGAIALGHPLGASGARITGTAAALLQRQGKQFAMAFACIGGGMGVATILEAV